MFYRNTPYDLIKRSLEVNCIQAEDKRLYLVAQASVSEYRAQNILLVFPSEIRHSKTLNPTLPRKKIFEKTAV